MIKRKTQDGMWFVIALAMIVGLTHSLCAAPDFFADKILSDGQGYIDTNLKFTGDGVPGISRIDIDYSTSDYAKGTSPGPVTSSAQPTIIGYTDGTTKKLIIRYSGDKGQIWYDGGNKTGINVPSGDVSLSVNYLTKKVLWGGNTFDLPDSIGSSAYSYYLFARHNGTVGADFAVFNLSGMKVYEISDGETEKRTHWFRPCCSDGKAALYDVDTDETLYPSTGGFTLSGYDITLAAGSVHKVAAVSSRPRNLSLAAGAHLIFDGEHFISPENEVQLPSSGTVGVTLERALGRGTYVLIENLPTDFNLSRFSMVSVPNGLTGSFVRRGTTLMMVLTTPEKVFPDAIADTLRSDGHGYINTGYSYHAAAYPKTARISLDFNTSDKAFGTPPGPTTESFQPALFGFQHSTLRTLFRYDSTIAQWWDDGGYKKVTSEISGDQTVMVDYINKKAAWGAYTDDFACAETDSSYPYFIFANNKNGSMDKLSVFDFKEMTIYEMNDSQVYSLVRDFVPCINNGTPGVYDKVNGGIQYPVSSTNGFTVSGAKWRIKVNGEVVYTNGIVSFESSATVAPDFWKVVRDSDGIQIADGTGALASFEMPEASVTLSWKYRKPGFVFSVR